MLPTLLFSKEENIVNKTKEPYEDVDWLYFKIHIQKSSYSQIARELKCGDKTISYWAKKFDIEKLTSWESINHVHGDSIEKMYKQEGRTLKDVTDYFGYSNKTIKKIFKHRDVEPNDRSDMTRIGAFKRERKYGLNQDYFKHWSREMAYIVGFINADGNVYRDADNGDFALQITIKEDDRDVVYKIKKALEYEGEVKFYTMSRPNGNTTDVANLRIGSKILTDDLIALGIQERKSLVKGVPEKLPKEYIFAYLRGYFDGNGTIDMRYERTLIPALRLRLTSGSERHLNEIQDILCEHGFSRKKIEARKGQNTFVLRFGNKETLFLYNRFYQNEDCIFMKRKKDRFDYCVNQRIKDIEHKKKHHKKQKGLTQGIRKHA